MIQEDDWIYRLGDMEIDCMGLLSDADKKREDIKTLRSMPHIVSAERVDHSIRVHHAATAMMLSVMSIYGPKPTFRQICNARLEEANVVEMQTIFGCDRAEADRILADARAEVRDTLGKYCAHHLLGDEESEQDIDLMRDLAPRALLAREELRNDLVEIDEPTGHLPAKGAPLGFKEIYNAACMRTKDLLADLGALEIMPKGGSCRIDQAPQQ